MQDCYLSQKKKKREREDPIQLSRLWRGGDFKRLLICNGKISRSLDSDSAFIQLFYECADDETD